MTAGARTELAEVLEEVRRIDLQSRRLVNDVMAGGYSSVFRGSGIEFDDVREFAEGDDLRAVDWNVTARTGRPFVKKYVDERELTVVFLVDLSPSMEGGFGPWSARQVAARVVACLALSAVRNHDKSGLVAFSAGVDHYLPPRKGLSHVLRLVRDCLVLRGSGGRTDLAPALDFALKALRRRAILFVISDFLAGGWEGALARCGRRHDAVAVRLLPPELDPPEAGLLRIRDPEGGGEEVADLASPRVRAAWTERAGIWRERTAAAIRRARVDLMDVPIPRTRDRDAVAGPILRFFRMRELRGTKK